MKYGILFSKGEYILMVDADGATDFNEVGVIYAMAIQVNKNGLACVIGNRNHEGNQA